MRVNQAKARFAVNLLSKLYEAAQDPRNWRTAIWLLEKKFPEKFGPLRNNVLTRKQHQDAFDFFAKVVLGNIQDIPTRDRVYKSLDAAYAAQGISTRDVRRATQVQKNDEDRDENSPPIPDPHDFKPDFERASASDRGVRRDKDNVRRSKREDDEGIETDDRLRDRILRPGDPDYPVLRGRDGDPESGSR